MFGLEFLVDCENVLVQGLREQVVDFLGQVDLSHLELGEVVGHDCVFVVGDNHLLKDCQVLARELPKALVYFPSDVWIVLLLSIDDLLNVVITLVKALTQLPKISLHQFPILQHLLILLHFLQAVC